MLRCPGRPKSGTPCRDRSGMCLRKIVCPWDLLLSLSLPGELCDLDDHEFGGLQPPEAHQDVDATAVNVLLASCGSVTCSPERPAPCPPPEPSLATRPKPQ